MDTHKPLTLDALIEQLQRMRLASPLGGGTCAYVVVTGAGLDDLPITRAALDTSGGPGTAIAHLSAQGAACETPYTDASAFDRLVQGVFPETPELVRRLAAYAYLATHERDIELNTLYGYSPRFDEVHPNGRAESTRYARAVWQAVRLVADEGGVSQSAVRDLSRAFRNPADAQRDSAPSGGQRLPDTLAKRLDTLTRYFLQPDRKRSAGQYPDE